MLGKYSIKDLTISLELCDPSSITTSSSEPCDRISSRVESAFASPMTKTIRGSSKRRPAQAESMSHPMNSSPFLKYFDHISRLPPFCTPISSILIGSSRYSRKMRSYSERYIPHLSDTLSPCSEYSSLSVLSLVFIISLASSASCCKGRQSAIHFSYPSPVRP